jgi:hypothetical protein
MNICHLVTKGFDGDTTVRRSITYNGTPLTIGVTHKLSNDVKEETVEFNKSLPDEVNAVKSLNDGKQELIDSPIGNIINNNGNILPLSSIYDYHVTPNDPLSAVLPIGADFDSLAEDVNTKDFLRDVAEQLFPHINPNTQDRDIQRDAYYTPYIPLVALTGCIPPQVQDGDAFFNPEGVVTVAEFLDGLNSIKYGCNANNHRKKTLDNISVDTDYFNEGYQSCIRGISSPFFNLYTRGELIKPITRLELAYITVICWNQFIDKFNNLYGGSFYLGINFDWELPSEVLSNYEDGFDYKVSKISIDEDYDIVSLDVKDYKSDRTMEEYKEDMKSGVAPIPMPMFMSMLELGILDLFHYEDKNLNPLKEVSRGELCYFLTKLAKLFPTRYMK